MVKILKGRTGNARRLSMRHLKGNLNPNDAISYPAYWLILCVNLIQARIVREKGGSVEEMPPWDPTVCAFSQIVRNGRGQHICE